jgi:hypothetical protein
VARGFESKDVEFQQAEAERAQARDRLGPLTSEEREAAAARRTIELALADLRRQRNGAIHPRHREMLEQAIHELEQRLGEHPAAGQRE